MRLIIDTGRINHIIASRSSSIYLCTRAKNQNQHAPHKINKSNLITNKYAQN